MDVNSPEAAEWSGLMRRNSAMEAALRDAREFIAGMSKPAAPGIMTISSYSPCHALLDKIDATLASQVG